VAGAASAYELKFDGDSALGAKAAHRWAKTPLGRSMARNRPNFARGPSSPGAGVFQDKARWGLNWLFRCLINPPLCGIA
jgi:hypothetical protein